jgi:6-pyruvoyltetrahydropterin/6-carboxytetrahydropterin synthase
MYRIEKRFTFPMGHRLSKHSGRCHSIHGHNFTVLVGLKAEQLNADDMIIDFSDLKSVAGAVLDNYDHKLLVNKNDASWMEPLAKELGLRASIFDHEDHDPTAERLSEQIFLKLDEIFSNLFEHFVVDYVTVFENENSKATYSKD